MFEEVIQGRYTCVQSILEEQLDAWYGKNNYKILVRSLVTRGSPANLPQSPPNDYAMWRIEVPQRLAYVCILRE